VAENKIYHGDNLEILKELEENSIDFIYTDPPFNTGRSQRSHGMSYDDSFDDLVEFLKPRLEEARRLLKPNGSIMVHLDYREVHYVKVYLDTLLGRDNFINEVIWSFDFGARQKNKWPTKHQTILWYAMDRKNYTYNYEAQKRIPYLAPGLCGPEKAAKGKTQTDVVFQTVCATNGPERTKYPSQKPLGLIDQFIKVHTNPGDLVLDFFAGSGTLGQSAHNFNRNFILIDQNKEAIEVMKKRFKDIDVDYIEKEDIESNTQDQDETEESSQNQVQ